MKNRSTFVLAAAACAAAFAFGRVSAEEKPAMPPSPPAEWIQKAEGKWDCKLEMFGEHASTSAGEATFTGILNGTILRQEFKSDMGGMPFEGLGYSHYDSAKNKCTDIWMDNMGGGMMVTTGSKDDKGVATVTGETDFGFGPMKVTNTVRWVNDDTMVFEMAGPGPDGKQATMMRCTYNRRK